MKKRIVTSVKEWIKKKKYLIYIVDKMRELYYRYLISDKRLINKQFKKILGRKANLENPVNFNDKLQWLKLFWHNPLAAKCADKYAVRNYVANTIGPKYLNTLIAVYDSVEEINLDELPKSFVLKGTHGSGFNIICENKNQIDWNSQFKKMKRWLWINFYWSKREWVYKDIKPRIICERYLYEDEQTSSLTDYKIYCFNGNPTFCQVIQDRGSEDVGTIDFFDTKWRHMEFTGLQIAPHSTENIQKPERYEEMLDLAARLATDFPFVRVDFYYVNGSIYFGELTFFPKSGFGEFSPPDWNKRIGDLLELPPKQ